MAGRTDIGEAKARTRREVAAVLAGVTQPRRREASLTIARRLSRLGPLVAARTIMAFLSLPTEVDTGPVIRWAWARRKRVAIPRIAPLGLGAGADARSGEMDAVALEPADVGNPADHPGLRPGAFGIPTAPEAPVVPPEQIDVVLVPCLAVDRGGNRLGRGGGYYDRFLPRARAETVRLALALGCQLLEEVPVDESDEPVDMVVTEADVLRFQR